MSLSTFFNIWYIDDSSLKASLLGPGPMVLHFTVFFLQNKVIDISLFTSCKKATNALYTKNFNEKKPHFICSHQLKK